MNKCFDPSSSMYSAERNRWSDFILQLLALFPFIISFIFFAKKLHGVRNLCKKSKKNSIWENVDVVQCWRRVMHLRLGRTRAIRDGFVGYRLILLANITWKMKWSICLFNNFFRSSYFFFNSVSSGSLFPSVYGRRIFWLHSKKENLFFSML